MDRDSDEDMVRSQLIVAPKATHRIGANFKWRGKSVRVEEMGFSHDSDAPPIVARMDRLIIGLIMGVSSFSETSGEQSDEDQIVEILNRIE